jgi:hypothetical protein
MDAGQLSSIGADTGTDDKTYNLVSVLYHALQGIENCEIYAEDADDEHRQFFEQACDQQRRIAQQAKQLLHDQLMYGEGIGQDGSQGTGQGSGQQMGGQNGQVNQNGESVSAQAGSESVVGQGLERQGVADQQSAMGVGSV